MEFNFILPENFIPQVLSDLLEKTWLVPRKQRHFLRTKKHSLVNDQIIDENQLLHAGDKVTLIFDKEDFSNLSLKFGSASLADILYEDEHLIVVNKPEGMKTHGNTADEIALQNHVAAAINQNVFVVHRLDQATSGAVLFAKNQFVLPILGKMFEENKIHREYLALVAGHLLEETFTINQAIGQNRHEKNKRIISKNGQKAITHVQLIQNFTDKSLVKCILDTGRTHQIRVHLSSLGHPIIGDALYGQKSTSRLMLHAESIIIPHPFTNQLLAISAPSPSFSNILNKIKKK
ncbi:RluA family pseudouridine synthase [Lactococcus cremoris]|uniref:Pseudouridine synthase n=1 Tax=Lactococcus lactis subsp. cremoris TaxID=1359 RepID=A0AAX4ABA5_LACLC|nr:RluA family pseudouridine synthase [Lactococcus cremoris]KGH33304.1 pseudouridine synthase [Lactococcus cremoris]QSE63599.1 RluA family pseudouridine synthase [Lactococcus cremoris]WMX71469.1 RluA family pseudouridine synthase [Lactococcus cremoris]